MISLKPTVRRIQSANYVKKKKRMKKLLKIFKKDKSHEGLSTYQELHDSHYNLNNEVGLISEELKGLGKQVSEHEWNTDTDDLKKDVKKLNNKLTDLHEAYRVELQNVNNLRKEMDDYCRNYEINRVKETIKTMREDLDQLKIEFKNDPNDHEWRIDRIEETVMKLSDKVNGTKKAETITLNPFEEYHVAKEQFVAAKMNLLLADVWSMEWNVRTINCLENNKIATVKDLCSYSEKSLLKTKNLGQKTLNEIKSVLAKYDLKLREKDDLDELEELQEKLNHEKD